MKKWKTLESHRLFKNQWFDIREERVQITDELAIEGVVVMNFSDWVNVVALTADRQLILVKQYRHGVGLLTTETPSGSMEDTDASPQDAAMRELFEETGYAVGQMISLGSSQANSQLMNNSIHHFLALNCHLVSQPQPEIGGIESFWTEPFETIFEKIRKGEVVHSYSIEGLYRAQDWLANNGAGGSAS